jgi:hypothetical protein
MAQLKLTADILTAAVIGFEVQKAEIDAKMSDIRRLLGDGTGVTAPDEPPKPRKKRSAAVRRRMKIAQQLRWTKTKQSSPPPADTAKPKRKVSRAARKKMAAAQKKRWAAIKEASGAQPRTPKRRQKTVKKPEQSVAQAAGQ